MADEPYVLTVDELEPGLWQIHYADGKGVLFNVLELDHEPKPVLVVHPSGLRLVDEADGRTLVAQGHDPK